jgi:hypothetical protein
MTTFAELASSVYAVTNRPDLVTQTQLAIQKATLKEHSAIDYPRDLAVSAAIALDNTAGNWRYDLSLTTLALASKLRKIRTIREVLATVPNVFYSFTGYWGEIDFTEKASDNLFDNYGLEKYNYYIRQGDILTLVAYRQVDNVGIEYYKRPIIAADLTYASWIADDFPYVIYEAAAADIFKLIGKDTEAQLYRQKMADNRLDVIKSEIGAI